MASIATGILQVVVTSLVIVRSADSTSLDLSNQGLTSIPDGADGNHIRKLNISSNDITEIQVNALNSYSHLVFLDMSYNQIAWIPPGCFTNLVALVDLNLDGNPLKVLEDATFDGLSLVSLSLQHTSLASFDGEAFAGRGGGLPSLLSLNLGFNRLHYIPKSTFDQLINLRKLVLSDNQIEALPTEIFAPIRYTIIAIDLSNNRITSLPEDIFKGLRELRDVDLSDNPLSGETMKLRVSSPNLTIHLCSGSCDLSLLPRVVLISESGSIEIDLTTSNETALAPVMFDAVDVTFCDDRGGVIATNMETGNKMTKTYDYVRTSGEMPSSPQTPGRHRSALIVMIVLVVILLLACISLLLYVVWLKKQKIET